MYTIYPTVTTRKYRAREELHLVTAIFQIFRYSLAGWSPGYPKKLLDLRFRGDGMRSVWDTKLSTIRAREECFLIFETIAF